MYVVDCKQCNGEMKKTKKTEKNMGLQLAGVILFFIGVCIAATGGIISWIIGFATILIALNLGYKRIKIWKCTHCGYYYNRD